MTDKQVNIAITTMAIGMVILLIWQVLLDMRKIKSQVLLTQQEYTAFVNLLVNDCLEDPMLDPTSKPRVCSTVLVEQIINSKLNIKIIKGTQL